MRCFGTRLNFEQRGGFPGGALQCRAPASFPDQHINVLLAYRHDEVSTVALRARNREGEQPKIDAAGEQLLYRKLDSPARSAFSRDFHFVLFGDHFR